MNLYDRDYFTLTSEEEMQKAEVVSKNTVKHGRFEVHNSKMYLEMSKAARHNDTLFPNNYLDHIDLKSHTTLSQLNKSFLEETEKVDSTELSIKDLIKTNKMYHIIGSILKGNTLGFGHHGTFIFPEFELGSSYRVDYLIAGKASGGFQFVFVEMEHPNSNITLSDGSLGEAFRKGLKQIGDWKSWLDSNYNSLHDVFQKSSNKSLPREFYTYDSSRMHYVVVAGKRHDFNDNTYSIKRRMKREQDILILHHDNLYDFSNRLIMSNGHTLTY